MGTKRPTKDEIFSAAAKLEQADERAAFIEQACGEDGALKAEIERLFERDRAKSSLPDQSTSGIGPTLDQPIAEKPGTVRSAPTSCCSRSAKVASASCTWPSRPSRSSGGWR